MSGTILVLGGGGLLGAPVSQRLHADGFTVRVLTRDAAKAQDRLGDTVEIVAGDAMQRADVDRALAGCDGAHLTLNGPAELIGAEHVAALAAQHGLKRITYISGATVGEQNRGFSLVDTKLRSEAAIEACGVPYTIFRPTWPMEMLRRFVSMERVALIGKQATPLHWFAADDLGRMVSTAYNLEAAANKCLYVHGPEGIPLKAALERAAAVLRPEVTSVSVMPIWLARLIATLTRNAEMQYGVTLMAYFERSESWAIPARPIASLARRPPRSTNGWRGKNPRRTRWRPEKTKPRLLTHESRGLLCQ